MTFLEASRSADNSQDAEKGGLDRMPSSYFSFCAE